jgi:hypothetical protein
LAPASPQRPRSERARSREARRGESAEPISSAAVSPRLRSKHPPTNVMSSEAIFSPPFRLQAPAARPVETDIDSDTESDGEAFVPVSAFLQN